MAGLCIPKSKMENLKKAFKDGDITLDRLYSMYEAGDDASMKAIFKSYLGEEFAQKTTSEFEKAFASRQKDALKKLIEKTFNPKQRDLRASMVKKLEKFDKFMKADEEQAFLESLANEKLGMRDVSKEEINLMIEKKQIFEDLEKKIPENAKDGGVEELAYGYALDDFQQYVGGLKARTTPLTAKEVIVQKLTNPTEIFYDVASATKGALASMDNSFFGRQGLAELFTPLTGGSKRWVTGFIKSWGDMAKQLVTKQEGKGIFAKQSDPVMRTIRAKILGSKNARNGKYAAAKNGYGLGVLGEEAFPNVPLIERIPLIGRLFKTSEVAFNGGALMMRKRLADAEIARAEKLGIDVMDKAEAEGMGNLVGIMTGRGDIGKADVYGKQINAAVFSIKFLKSNLDILLSPVKYGTSKLRSTVSGVDEAGLYAKKRAAQNLAQIVVSVATIAIIANKLSPGSFETNPQSTNFGKIKIKGHYFDITRGMGSITVLASRIVTGTSISSTGKKSDLYNPEYGGQTALDLVDSFWQGKLSPIAGVFRDILKGKNYQGKKPTIKSIVKGTTTPIIIQTIEQLKNPSFADALLVIIGDGLGFSASTPKK